MLNHRHIEYLFAVEKYGSFTKAANSLNVSQPSLSRIISDLEDRLGFSIFDRNSSPIIPTQEGLIYLNACRNVITIEQNTMSEISYLKSGMPKKLSIAMNSPCIKSLAPEIIQDFKTNFPEVQVSLIHHSLHQMEDVVMAGIADIAITDTTNNHTLSHEHFTTENLFVVVPPYYAEKIGLHPGMNKTPIDINALKNEPLILLRQNHGMRRAADKMFSQFGITPNVVFETDDYEIARLLSEKNFGFSFTTSLEKPSTYTNTTYICKLQNFDFPRHLYICYNKQKEKLNSFSKILTIIKESVKVI